MPKTLIAANPTFQKAPGGGINLFVSEMFSETIQGEGINIGVPAVFLRLQECTLNCSWCDSKSVWRYGNPYSIDEILNIWESSSVIDNFEKGCHLVLTGGSPLYQQHNLFQLLKSFVQKYEFLPYIEIENECVLRPIDELVSNIKCWNNSPKLESSGNSKRAAYKPEIIKKVASLDNSWFKFVVIDELDWNEIERDYLIPGLIDRSQIILMPCGETQEELKLTRELTVNIAVREGVRFSDRVHITIWDKKTGV